MITRRFTAAGFTALGLSAFGLAGGAWALAPLSDKERRALTRLAQLAPSEAARFGAMPPLYRRCAATYRLSNKSLAFSLETIARALARAASELDAGGRALPKLPAAADRTSPALRGLEREAPSAWGPVAGPTIAPADPPSTTESLTSWVVIADIRTSARTWRDLAGSLRALGRDSPAALAQAASHFEQAATQLGTAARVLGRVLERLNPREHEDSDRLGNFDLQDLMQTLNQNQSLASTTLRELSNIRMDTIRRIGG